MLVDLSRNDEVAPYLVTTAPDVADLDQPGRLHQPQGRLRARRAARRWGSADTAAEVGRGADGPAHRARHQRDEPVPAARPARAVAATCPASRCCRSAPSTTRSCCAGSTRSSTRSTPARGSSSPARRPGVTLAPEGGAHQSTITASVGLELPEVTLIEPAYARARSTGCCATRSAGSPPAPGLAAAVGRRRRAEETAPTTSGSPPGRSTRRRSRPPAARLGDARAAPAGARRRLPPGRRDRWLEPGAPQVSLVASGAVLPEVLAAAAELAAEGIAAHVVDVTSLDRLYGAWQRDPPAGDPDGDRRRRSPARCGRCFPDRTPVVTVHDAVVARDGVDRLGARRARRCRSGSTSSASPAPSPTCTRCTTWTPGSIVNAALAAISLR